MTKKDRRLKNLKKQLQWYPFLIVSLVALVLFKNKMVYIRFVGTHQEYERIQDIKNI